MVDLRRSRPGRTWPVPLALFLACLAAAGCDGSRASDPPLLEERAALAQTPGSSAIPGQPASAGWTSGSFMSNPRLSHTARRLTSGKVIVAGGITDAPAAAIPDPASYSVSSSTEIYDPQTNDWQFLPSMLDDRIEHAMVTQPLSQPPDGGVLVIGGRNDFNEILSSAEIFDGSFWQSKAQLLEARAGHTATRLSDARVLVVGGYNGGGIPTAGALGGDPGVPSSFVPLCSAEIFDPTAAGGLGAFVPTGALAQCRTSHAETLLTGDRVLVTGGEADGVPMASAEAWSPMSGTWTQLPPMSMPRTGHTATRLNNGLVLVVGGHNGVNDLKSAEVFDPIAIAWTTVGPMSAGRSRHTAVLLNDGRVLITGGYQDGSALSSAEIFDLVTKTFTPTAPMSEFRARHSATLLANGEVLVAGGDNLVGDPSITASAEIFSLSPGAGKPCDVAADCPDGFCVDGVCCDAACDQPCQACTQAARGGPGAPDGTCAPVVKGLDPADECAGTPAPGCGTTGVCDGVGACQLHPLGTECKPGACDGTTAQTTSTCDGKGVCISGAMLECEPFACIGGACLKGCKGPPDCAPTAFCDVAGNCKPKLPDGAVATDPVQCLSGFAIDGVCCDTACDQECQTCAKDLGAVANGVCSPLSGVQCDDGTACTQLDVCQSGQCVGMQPVNCPGDTGCQGGLACDPKTGACTVPLPPKNPGDSCEDGDVCTEGDTCDAAGACAGGAVDCSPGECQSAGQCVPEVGCQFEPSPDFTECTKDDNPCTAEVCKSGVCLFNNNLDGVPCPGGTCFAGGCLPDSGGTTTGAGTGTGTGTGTGSGGDGGNAGPAGGGDPGAGGSGAGGAAAGGSGEGGYSLLGGACSTPAGGADGSGLAGAALALLGLAGARRRRRGAR